MQNITFDIAIRKDKIKKDGKCPICIRLYISEPNNKKQETKVLIKNISVNPDNWDNEKKRVKKNEPNYLYKNQIITNTYVKAEKIILSYLEKEKKLTFDLFRRELYNEGYDTNFYDFCNEVLNNYYPEQYTRDNFNKHIRKLKKYAPILNFSDLNESFLLKYKTFLLQNGNKESTVDRNLRSIKALVRHAIRMELIKFDPFKNIHFKSQQGKNDCNLTFEEVDLLYKYYKKQNNLLSSKQNKSLKAFLFACATSLRIGEIQSLKYENIKNDFLCFVESKTKKYRKKKIPSKAMQFIENKNIISNKQKVFNMLSDQKTNMLLKTIAKEINNTAGNKIIREDITFHFSRRTFGSRMKENCKDIAIVQHAIGHSRIEITENSYAETTDESVYKEVENLGNYLFKNE